MWLDARRERCEIRERKRVRERESVCVCVCERERERERERGTSVVGREEGEVRDKRVGAHEYLRTTSQRPDYGLGLSHRPCNSLQHLLRCPLLLGNDTRWTKRDSLTPGSGVQRDQIC